MSQQEFEIYIGYLDSKRDEIASGEPLVAEIRDMATFERKVVKAIIARSADELPGADLLWVMDWVERREPAPWAIRVLEELEEDTDVALSRSDIDEEDLTRMAQDSQLFADGKYGGDGLAIGWGEDEAQKYLGNIKRMEQRRQMRKE
ncbi:MAG: hypothetical protein HY675_13320 [Chloroflexi bacterium]|nr:hypothetical protein [Chloroflexota bacterium]